MNRYRNLLRVLLPILVLSLGILGGWQLKRSATPPESAPEEVSIPLVRTAQAESRPIELTVKTRGSVVPRTETRLASEVAARVIEISPSFADGAFFERDEVLLLLDATDLLLAESQARAQIATAEMAIAQEEADARIARRDWESRHPEEPASPLVLREPQLARARADLEAARAALTKAERDVERCTIRAPYDGRVRKRTVDQGQFVTYGAELGVLYAVDWAEVRLPVPDEDLARLDLTLDEFLARRPATDDLGGTNGDAGPAHPEVELTASFGGTLRRWRGEVVRTEGELDAESRMVVLVARVEDPYGRQSGGTKWPLLSGLFVEATIRGRQLESAVVIPRAALQSGKRAFVLSAENQLEIRELKLVEACRDELVLASGVDEGERVVISPIELPVEGMHLREQQPLEDSQ